MLARAPRDPDALRSILHDDVEWNPGPANLLGARDLYRGPDGVLEFFREWVGAFTDWGYDVGEMFAEGESVIAELHQYGTGRASGVRVEHHWWQVWTLRDGKAIRGLNVETREEAVAIARGG